MLNMCDIAAVNVGRAIGIYDHASLHKFLNESHYSRYWSAIKMLLSVIYMFCILCDNTNTGFMN